MARVVLGVGGGIAAYKSCELLRRLRGMGHSVRVVPTHAALEFVGVPTWEALSGEPVSAETFHNVPDVDHVRIGQTADVVMVAPATADLLARAAHGLAADLLGNVLLTTTAPVVFAPAMHTEMWHHPATQANVALLRARGAMVIDPAVGQLTGVDSGPGRLPEPAELAAAFTSVLDSGIPPRDLEGRRVVVSAGGTHEALDPVRYLGNRSSGKQGYAIAISARDRGADVVLVAAHTDVADPAGVRVLRADTARDVEQAMAAEASGADFVVMAAAIADYRPAEVAPAKLKKQAGGLTAIQLVENPDILAGLVANRGAHHRPVLVGFAAETGDATADALAHGRRKFAAKGCDVMVVNQVGTGLVFGQERTSAAILTSDTDTALTDVTKRQLAETLWDLLSARYPRA